MTSQEVINGAIDQWSKRLFMVVRSQDGHTEHRFHQFCDVCKLQTLFLSVPWLENDAGIGVFEQSTYQLLNKEYLIAIFQLRPFFILPINFRTLVKTTWLCDSGLQSYGLLNFARFFLEHPVYNQTLKKLLLIFSRSFEQ